MRWKGSSTALYEKDINKPPLLILTGPTSVGKSALSIALAKTVDGEIISADSMQVYRYMDIGSAKISKGQMEGIPHHMIDILDPSESFNINLFQKKAKETIQEIYDRGRIPILVGGTGFYIQSVLYDIDFTEESEPQTYRTELERLAEQKGPEYLHEMLVSLDPESAQAIHPNNIKRVIRALEYYQSTGGKISDHNRSEREKEATYNACYFVLNDDRAKIYERIDTRVDQMMEEGLVEEVKRLRSMGMNRNMVSMQGLGYKEILSYLEGEIPLERAVYLIKRDTRHFAKRQLTWFRRERDVIWVNKQEFDYEESRILDYMIQNMYERGILRGKE